MHSDVDQFEASASASAPPSLLHELSCYIHGGDNMTHTQLVPFQLPQFQHLAPADLYKQIKAEKLELQDQSAITMSATSASGEASFSSGTMGDGGREASNLQTSTATDSPQTPVKRKRNLPGTPDPDAEVIALSPKTLMATNRFVCEICNKGFQRDQNLQLHRRGHNLPWKLKQRTSKEIRKRVYICPEPSCVHHDPKRALGDLTGIKKHFCRKHGEKKWKCEKCSKRYAVQSDWKAHSKTCGTREYRCDCGTLFSRRDSFITHRAFCDALAEENAKSMAAGSGAQQAISNQTIPMGDISSTHASMARLGENSMDVSKLSFRENGLQLLPPRWEQPNTSNSCGTRPRLNLGLGTSAGPGPPTNEHLIGGPQHLQSSFLNTKEAQNGSPSELEGQKALPSLMPFGSGTSAIFGPGGANLAGMIRPNFGQIGRIVDGMSGLIWTSDGGTMSPSENSSSSTNTNSNARPSVFNQSTAQMSATALLQKAAQMGATTRSPSLFRGLGMESTASYGGNLGSAWAGIATEQGGRGTTISNNFMHSFPPHMRNSADLPNGRSFNPPNFGGMHELMNSLSASASSNFPPLFGDMGSLEEIIQNRPNSQQADSQGAIIQSGLMKAPFNSSSMIPGHANMMPKVEDPGANDRLTRDFLGVGGVSGMVGAPKSVLASLNQRDLAAITSCFGPAANMGPFGINHKNE